jgi:hypothetical protein
MKYLYKYPQSAYPYSDLVAVNPANEGTKASAHYASVIPASQVRELGKLAAILEAEPSPTEVARVKAAPRKAQ